MVLPSDITRWGFVKADPNEFQEIFFEGCYTDYKSGEWRLVLFDYSYSENENRVAIINGHFELERSYCSGPHHIYNLLKKVGYLQ